jgi:isopentenyl-diphosphate delta-isomerase
VTSGFEAYRLVNCALPEMDLADVDTSCSFLGRALRAPLLISCMTGGTPQARVINRVLARVAQEHGVAMGLGSARALLESPNSLDTFAVRDAAPDIALLANFGAVQLNKGYGVEDCRRLVEMLQADALVLHLNALQEAVQPEGDTCFRDLLRKIEVVCGKLGAPVVVKEVGWGIAPQEVRALFAAGVAGIDLAGAGGTSWTEVERHRIAEPWRANVAGAFAGWGIPTAECLRGATQIHPRGFLIASGGIAGGMDVVKALALGADVAGIAGPFLRAAAQGYEAASQFAREIIEELRIAMFALGEPSLAQLRSTKRIVRERD